MLGGEDMSRGWRSPSSRSGGLVCTGEAMPGLSARRIVVVRRNIFERSVSGILVGGFSAKSQTAGRCFGEATSR
jgi:hypothetical protein